MIKTLQGNFYCPKLHQDVKKAVKHCELRQEHKITGQKKHGKIPLPSAHANMQPWQKIHIDLAGPWTTRCRKSKSAKTIDFKLQVLTIIDHATGYPELAAIITKQSDYAAKKTDAIWFCRCPRPQECTRDNGT